MLKTKYTKPLSEFAIIDRFFKPLSQIKNRFSSLSNQSPDLIGDDGAVLNIPTNQQRNQQSNQQSDQQLVVASDTLISGVHFPVDLPAEAIGYRSLATNLSDLAAMGATPAWYSLCISLADNDADWLYAFMQGLARAARQYEITLIGGDTTHSTRLSISMQLIGFVKTGEALSRHGAKPGDWIYVTDNLGLAAAGLEILQGTYADYGEKQCRAMVNAFCYPQVHSKFAMELSRLAHSAIDISDGFAADVEHMAKASCLQARVYVDCLPINPTLCAKRGASSAIAMALNGGDDYALCFTIDPAKQNALEKLAATHQVKLTRVGEMRDKGVDKSSVAFWSAKEGKKLEGYRIRGYRHF